MNPRLKMLVWKEWRERRWQWWLALAWPAVAVLAARVKQEPVYGYCGQVSMAFSFLMPLLIAIPTALGESAEGRAAFAAGLPIASARQAWLRLIGGWLVLVVPIVLATLIGLASLTVTGQGWRPEALHQSFVAYAWGGAIIAMLTSGLYLVLCCLGTFVRGEFRLGMAGVLATILWGTNFGMGFPPYYLDRISPTVGFVCQAITPNPIPLVEGKRVTDFATQRHHDAERTAIACHLLLVQPGLALLFIRRYGRLRRPTTGKSWFRFRVIPAWGRRGSRNRYASLAWLTARQSLPIALPAFGIMIFMVLIDRLMRGDLQHRPDPARNVMEIVALSLLLWSVVLGAGIFSDEIDSRIGETWRAWPIPLGRFFAIKSGVGLAMVLVVLSGPAIVAIGYSWLGRTNTAVWQAYLVCMAPLHAALFSLAAFWSCLLRRGTLGAALAVATSVLFWLLLQSADVTSRYEPLEAFNSLGSARRPLPHAEVIPAALIVLTAIFTALAYLALAKGGSVGLGPRLAAILLRKRSLFRPKQTDGVELGG